MDNEKKENTSKQDATKISIEKDEKEKLQAQCEEYKNDLKRLAAEFDNYKKRTTKEIEQAFELGKLDVLNHFLDIYQEVLISLEPINSSGEVEKIKEGLKILQKKLSNLLTFYNIEEIDCSGEPDPHLHEVILKVDGEPDGHIAKVIKKGYTINGKLLRPAKVSIYKKIEKKEQKQEKEEKDKKKENEVVV
ncbi:MAG: nucleotide exchange factor GrpE [Candidatus Anstonellaceae archaeon]